VALVNRISSVLNPSLSCFFSINTVILSDMHRIKIINISVERVNRDNSISLFLRPNLLCCHLLMAALPYMVLHLPCRVSSFLVIMFHLAVCDEGTV
jgi:hypothetical protein